MEVIGTEGMLVIDLLRSPLIFIGKNGYRYKDLLTWPQVKEGIGGAIREELSHFINCIRQDREPLVGGLEGKKSLEVAIMATESAKMQLPKFLTY